MKYTKAAVLICEMCGRWIAFCSKYVPTIYKYQRFPYDPCVQNWCRNTKTVVMLNIMFCGNQKQDIL